MGASALLEIWNVAGINTCLSASFSWCFCWLETLPFVNASSVISDRIRWFWFFVFGNISHTTCLSPSIQSVAVYICRECHCPSKRLIKNKLSLFSTNIDQYFDKIHFFTEIEIARRKKLVYFCLVRPLITNSKMMPLKAASYENSWEQITSCHSSLSSAPYISSFLPKSPRNLSVILAFLRIFWTI